MGFSFSLRSVSRLRSALKKLLLMTVLTRPPLRLGASLALLPYYSVVGYHILRSPTFVLFLFFLFEIQTNTIYVAETTVDIS